LLACSIARLLARSHKNRSFKDQRFCREKITNRWRDVNKAQAVPPHLDVQNSAPFQPSLQSISNRKIHSIVIISRSIPEFQLKINSIDHFLPDGSFTLFFNQGIFLRNGVAIEIISEQSISQDQTHSRLIIGFSANLKFI
jgi:hypothetical protein